MHVLLGVIPYTINLMLNNFVFVKSYFSLDVLNQRILCFKFSRTESADKPCSIKENMLQSSSTIHQSGMYLNMGVTIYMLMPMCI